MRRITAVGLSALALCAVIGTSTGTAHADATVGYGVLADTAGQASPPPIGKKHHFHFWIKGSDVTGTWYWAQNGGSKDRWLKITAHNTTNDGKQAAFCWKMTGLNGTLCATTSPAKGSKVTRDGWVKATAHFSVKAAVGHTGPSQSFIITKSGPWHKIF